MCRLNAKWMVDKKINKWKRADLMRGSISWYQTAKCFHYPPSLFWIGKLPSQHKSPFRVDTMTMVMIRILRSRSRRRRRGRRSGRWRWSTLLTLCFIQSFILRKIYSTRHNYEFVFFLHSTHAQKHLVVLWAEWWMVIDEPGSALPQRTCNGEYLPHNISSFFFPSVKMVFMKYIFHSATVSWWVWTTF